MLAPLRPGDRTGTGAASPVEAGGERAEDGRQGLAWAEAGSCLCRAASEAGLRACGRSWGRGRSRGVQTGHSRPCVATSVTSPPRSPPPPCPPAARASSSSVACGEAAQARGWGCALRPPAPRPPGLSRASSCSSPCTCNDSCDSLYDSLYDSCNMHQLCRNVEAHSLAH